MPRKRKNMREIRSILYYRLEKGISADCTAKALQVSKGTVINTVKRFNQSDLSWPLSSEINDAILEHALYPPRQPLVSSEVLGLPSIEYLEEELAKKHVTLQCLYEEYCQSSPEPISRASFYRHFRKNRSVSCSMPMEYKGGDLLFIDYSGDGLDYIDRNTGEIISVELFCCCWGAGNYSYSEATYSQKKEDFVHSHTRAFRYFTAVSHGLVPDNLKSAVKKSDRYVPTINPLYEEMARHYNTAILPARVRKPRDKSKIENGVLHIQRFILARLRNHEFFSIQEINNALLELLEEFNTRPMKDYGNQSRRERFERLDKPYAQKLPSEPFRISEVKLDVLIGKNYHIRYEDHFYSAPFGYVGKRVKVRRNGGMVELQYKNELLTRHLYSTRKYGYTTKKEHMPQAHQFVKGLTPGWIIGKASEIGPSTVEVISEIMKRTEHIQQGFNAALGVLRLAKVYTNQRLENAAKRCVFYRMKTYQALKSVLKNNLENQPYGDRPNKQENIVNHENIRGDYQ
jgi:transposase